MSDCLAPMRVWFQEPFVIVDDAMAKKPKPKPKKKIRSY